MDTLARCFMSVLLLSAVLSSGLAEEKFFVEGGSLELGPNFSDNIETVTWKLNNDMIAEWLKKFGDLTYYSTFKDRTTLDKVTGTLNITKLTPADSGVYTVEINNMVRPERYNVKVIKEVPQPVVEFKPLVCSAALESCNLVCEGNTEGAEPFTYSWKMGEGDWVDGAKSRTIKPNETKSIKTFSCRIKNPISKKHSDPKENIFHGNEEVIAGGPNVGGIIAGLLVGILVAALVGLVIWKRKYLNEKIQSLRGHGKIVTINDEENGMLLKNGTSDGQGGLGEASTQRADGEPDAASTQRADGEPDAASTQRAGGEPDAASTQGAGGPDAESTQGPGGPDAASTQGAGGPDAESTQGVGGPDAASTQGAGGPDAESTQGAGGPDAESTQGAGGTGAASTQGAGGPDAESTQGAGGPGAESTEGAGGPDAESTEGPGGQSAAASKSGTEAGIDEESDTT